MNLCSCAPWLPKDYLLHSRHPILDYLYHHKRACLHSTSSSHIPKKMQLKCSGKWSKNIQILISLTSSIPVIQSLITSTITNEFAFTSHLPVTSRTCKWNVLENKWSRNIQIWISLSFSTPVILSLVTSTITNVFAFASPTRIPNMQMKCPRK